MQVKNEMILSFDETNEITVIHQHHNNPYLIGHTKEFVNK